MKLNFSDEFGFSDGLPEADEGIRGYTGGMSEAESCAERVARVEAEYRAVLGSAVEFEKAIRDRWREKCREKNRRISELESRVAELERRLEEQHNEGS